MNFAAINGITLYYAVEGPRAGPPLVFVNSLGTDLRIWDRVVPHFSHRFRIVRYDKRGHGLSDSPPGPYALGDHTADLAGLLEHVNVEVPLLVGISVGGMIALDYAANNPVSALVLSDTAAKIGTEVAWNERIAAIRQQGMETMAEPILARWFSPSYAQRQPAAFSGYRNMLARMPASGYTGTCAALRDADLRGAVEKVRAGTLVLCGAQDPATPPDLVRGLAESLPAARFEPVDGAGHLPCIEQPQAMAAKMNQFFEENGYG